jgi:acetyl-CoA C-acetyltransferase
MAGPGSNRPPDAVRSPVYVVSAVRTPIGRFLGGLSGLTAVELGTAVARAALERGGIAPAAVEQVVFGHARQAGAGPNPARQVAIAAGMPAAVPGYTVNMACASGLKAIELGAAAIAAGEAEIVLAGGMESMSRVPHLVEGLRTGHKLGALALLDGMERDGFLCRICNQLMGATAETLADRYRIGREEQDRYALESQRRAAAAIAAGRFTDEIVPVSVPGRGGARVEIAIDEHPRPETTATLLATLKPVFREGGTVTAGNSSGIVDGAAALVLASERAVRAAGREPLGRLAGFTSAGVDPAVMGLGPVPAVQALLARSGRRLADLPLIELNEAFAAQVLACDRELDLDRERLNVNGGAIALGHPIGASGARIVVTLIHEMRRREVAVGLATLCVSGGQGMAALVTRD